MKIKFQMRETPEEYQFPFESTMQAIMKQCARELASQRDEIIRAAITEVIGAGWNVERIIPRLRLIFDGESQLLQLDGQTILIFYPMESDIRKEGDFTSYWESKIKYRDLTHAYIPLRP